MAAAARDEGPAAAVKALPAVAVAEVPPALTGAAPTGWASAAAVDMSAPLTRLTFLEKVNLRLGTTSARVASILCLRSESVQPHCLRS